MPLPAGFVLDQQPQQPEKRPHAYMQPVSVPQGFVLDSVPAAQPETPSLSSAFVDYTQSATPAVPENAPSSMTEGNLFFDGQSGIIPEGTRVVATGAKDLANAGISLAELIGGIGARIGGVEPGTLPRIPEWDQIGNGFQALEPQTAVGQFLTPMGQYVGGRGIIGKATGEVATKVGERTAMEAGKDLARDAATDFAAFSPEDQRISDAITQAAANPTDGFWNNVAQLVAKTGVPQFLARGENDGSTPEGNLTSRAQNVGEGLILGELTRYGLKGVKIGGSALLSPFFKGVANAAEKEAQLTADLAAKAKKPIEDLTVQDVAELARQGYIPAQDVLNHPEVQQKMSEQVRGFMDAGTLNPNSPEFISQLEQLTQRVQANTQRTSTAAAIPQADRDAAIRTLWGEARGEGDDGVAAAANVILNRAEKNGESLTNVVRAPKQFSAWDDPRTRPGMDALSPSDPEYQRIGAILDEVASGKRGDNTGGATHYISFDGQKANGDAVPNWAKGTPTASVGRHTFFSPDGAPVTRKGGQITVTPEGTAFKGGMDAGARAGADAADSARQAADEATAAQAAAAKASDDEFMAMLARQAETNPLARTIAETDLPVEAKRAAYERVAPQIEAEARPAISDQPMIASPEGRPARGFDASTPRADQEYIMGQAERRQAEAQVADSNVNAAVQNDKVVKGKVDDRLGKIELGATAKTASAHSPVDTPSGQVAEPAIPAAKPQTGDASARTETANTNVRTGSGETPKRNLKGLREAAASGDEAVDKYMAPDMVPSAAKLTASKNVATQQVGHGIQDAAPELNALRDDMDAGIASKKMDISDALETAASAVDNARNEGLTPRAGADLVKGDKMAEQVYRIMHNKNLSRPATREEIADRLGRFVDEAARAGDDADPVDILKRIADTPDTPRGQTDMFDQFDNGVPNREAIKAPKSDRDVVDNIEAIGGKLEQRICGL